MIYYPFLCNRILAVWCWLRKHHDGKHVTSTITRTSLGGIYKTDIYHCRFCRGSWSKQIHPLTEKKRGGGDCSRSPKKAVPGSTWLGGITRTPEETRRPDKTGSDGGAIALRHAVSCESAMLRPTGFCLPLGAALAAPPYALPIMAATA